VLDYLTYKLTGKVPYYSRLVKVAKRYGWIEPEIKPAAWYIVALSCNGTEFGAFWNYKNRNWIIRKDGSEVDRGMGFNTFVKALKIWKR
jgi:hypothetical protein